MASFLYEGEVLFRVDLLPELLQDFPQNDGEAYLHSVGAGAAAAANLFKLII